MAVANESKIILVESIYQKNYLIFIMVSEPNIWQNSGSLELIQ